MPAGTPEISLNSFRDSAQKGQVLHVVHDGCNWKVCASDFSVAERFGGQIQVDTTSVFAASLGRAFSAGIQAAVVRELALAPQPGAPLESRLVLQAIAMAEASRQALEGVDFMTRLMFGAATGSGGFQGACRALGLLPEAIDAQQRARVDACMQERFSQAAHQGQMPVAPALAQQWLQAELMALKVTPDTH